MYTDGAQQLVHSIRGRQDRWVTFPAGLRKHDAYRNEGEPAHVWLRRSVDEHVGGDLRLAQVEENLAMFLVLDVRKQGKLLCVEYANVQALWTDGPLARFIEETEHLQCGPHACRIPHQYMRLDYDPTGALGPLLKEPQPHVHVEAEGEPRFPVAVSDAEDPVGWFLDFIYRNFFHADWEAWVEKAWTEHYRGTGRRDNPWERIKQAFTDNKIAVLEREHLDDVRALKKCVFEKRRAMFPFRVPRARCELLSHETVA